MNIKQTQVGRGRGVLVALLAVFLAACAAKLTKVETGEVVIKERLMVKTDSAWNQFDEGLVSKVPTWTKEGVTIDSLSFFVGIKDGEVLLPLASSDKGIAPPIFKATMQPEELVSLYQSVLTRDGSTFVVKRIEPADFLGGKGFRVEFVLTRKLDDVRLQGLAYGAVKAGQFHMISFVAPRLRFFDQYAPQAEAIAKSARLRG